MLLKFSASRRTHPQLALACLFISITLLGSGIALGSNNLCFVATPSSDISRCVASCNSGSISVLMVKLTAGSYPAEAHVTLILTSFMTPSNAQAELVNVSAATSNDLSAASVVVSDFTTAGKFPEILGVVEASITSQPRPDRSATAGVASCGLMLISAVILAHCVIGWL
jgi:hypothetical protein